MFAEYRIYNLPCSRAPVGDDVNYGKWNPQRTGSWPDPPTMVFRAERPRTLARLVKRIVAGVALHAAGGYAGLACWARVGRVRDADVRCDDGA